MKRRATDFLLNHISWLVFGLMLIVFGSLSPAFLQRNNLLNIVVQTSSTGILAVGLTFVLLTAGVDLSVGSIMFVAAAVGGKMVLSGVSLPWVLAAMVTIGAAIGMLNALFITRLVIMAFVVTLATRYLGRGFGLWITETRAMNLPDDFYALGAARLVGVPVPVWVLVAVAGIAHLVLTGTPFGRQVYAVGADRTAAAKAGVSVRWIEFAVYVICGACAALAGIVSLTQAPAVSPGFGNNREFMAIAAAVLGGTSLFGGRGAVLPGTLLGALLIQSIENGLNVLNVNSYLYPLITSAVIFVAVFLDSVRHRVLALRHRRRIFVDNEAP